MLKKKLNNFIQFNKYITYSEMVRMVIELNKVEQKHYKIK